MAMAMVMAKGEFKACFFHIYQLLAHLYIYVCRYVGPLDGPWTGEQVHLHFSRSSASAVCRRHKVTTLIAGPFMHSVSPSTHPSTHPSIHPSIHTYYKAQLRICICKLIKCLEPHMGESARKQLLQTHFPSFLNRLPLIGYCWCELIL